MQVLEGEQAVVEALFAKVSRDDRHVRIHVLRQGTVAARSFAAWSMGFVSLDARLMREFPKRHALSSNGTLIDDSSAVLEVLDGFRRGRFHSFILG